MSGFELRRVRVTGPDKKEAEIEFSQGLNVVSGPSDTGKSYLVELIDFMLGGQNSPRRIPESVGYTRAHLLIETKAGKRYELTRALEGGDFQLRDFSNAGLAPIVLAGRHNPNDPQNISSFLLQLLGLDRKRLRKNSNNELQNLSFRGLSPLLIIDEEAIIKKQSPILSGESTQRTAQISLFKMLMTGEDDSALIATKKRAIVRAEIEGQIIVLDEMIAEYAADLNEITEASNEELEAQLVRLNLSIQATERAVATEQVTFGEQERARREAWQTSERIQIRLSEIAGLKERFALLDESYASDLQRLESIAEAGAYFVALPEGSCPLCGAAAGDHRHDSVPEDGDIQGLRVACVGEIAKIRQLRLELSEAIASIDQEQAALSNDFAEARQQFHTATALVRRTLAPALSAARSQVNELYERRAEVRRAIGLGQRIVTLTARRADAEAALSSAGRVTDERPGLPAASVKAISVAVQELLDAWNFPHDKPVFYDERTQDMVLGSRRRGDQGKGLRALTHAAFTVGLQQAIVAMGRSPMGFVVLDSPLVTFREADNEDDLRSDEKVAVKQAFYSDLAGRGAVSQIIVFENEDPDASLQDRARLQFFSKQHTQGRYGFFPTAARNVLQSLAT